jgi:hypothetical protein
MSPQSMSALMRRHRLAAVAVLVVAALVAFAIELAPTVYTDSATVVFSASASSGFFNDQSGLLTVDALTADSVMSQAGQQQVKAVGGTASYDVALVNFNDEDYPNYSDPYVTVTTTSASPAAVQGTFSAVMHVLKHDLAAMQARQGANPATWIQASISTAPTGPVAQTGSQKRVLAALMVLTLIAVFMTARFLDRRPVRLRRAIARFRGAGPQPSGQTAG